MKRLLISFLLFTLLSSNTISFGMWAKKEVPADVINHPERYSQSALGAWLAVAAREGKVHEVERLLAAGVDPNSNGEVIPFFNSSISAFCYAVSRGHEEVFRLFVRYINQIDLSMINTALHYAAYNNRMNICAELLACGANINDQSDHQRSPLIGAACNGNEEMCRLLLSKGARHDLQDNEGRTALMVAANNGRLEICKLLLANGAHVCAMNNEGDTSFLVAAKRKHENVCDFLMNQQRQQNESIMTLLMSLKRLQKAHHPLGVLYRERRTLLMPYLKNCYFPLGRMLNKKDIKGKSAAEYLSELACSRLQQEGNAPQIEAANLPKQETKWQQVRDVAFLGFCGYIFVKICTTALRMAR